MPSCWHWLFIVLVAGTTTWSAERPNVLMIAVDDLRPELGCYGVSHIKTPQIDRFAQTALRFERAYCQQAVCSPSRTSLLTGLRPDSTKVYDLETHFRNTVPDVVTLPQQFLNAGYHSVGMGKIFHGGLDDKASWSEPWSSPKRPGYANPQSVTLIQQKQQAARQKGLKKKAASRAARGPAYECEEVPDDTYHDGALANAAVEKLGKLAQMDKPFFFAVGFHKPHLPFVAPKKYWDLYDAATISLADNPYHPHGAPPFALVNSGELRNYEGVPKLGPIPDDMARTLRHAYYASVSYTDANIGRLLDALDQFKLAENTIVILWGDHGWKLGEHGEWCKHSNVENDTRVVLMVRAPHIPTKNAASKALVEFVDVYPSLCELAGIPLPDHLEGTSFAPLLKDPAKPWKSAAFSQYPRGYDGQQLMGYSLRTADHRYTQWVLRKDRRTIVAEELYDHRNDPQENQNVADRPASQELITTFRRQMAKGWKGAKPQD